MGSAELYWGRYCTIISIILIDKGEEELTLRRRRKYQRNNSAGKDKHSLIVNPKFRARQKIKGQPKKKRLVKFAR